MKGIIFTELLNMVETNMGAEMVETIIDNAKLESGGAYTTVGTYPTEEIEALVHQLELQTQLSRDQLLEVFGKYLFGSLADNYPHFFPEGLQFFDFLAGIHDYIHVEVRKLYPDAELPDLKVVQRTDKELVLLYESSRKMAHLATGLLNGCMEHFKVDANIDAEKLNDDKSKVQFRITLN